MVVQDFLRCAGRLATTNVVKQQSAVVAFNLLLQVPLNAIVRALVADVDRVLVVASVGDAVGEFARGTKFYDLGHQPEMRGDGGSLAVQSEEGLTAVYNGDAIELHAFIRHPESIGEQCQPVVVGGEQLMFVGGVDRRPQFAVDLRLRPLWRRGVSPYSYPPRQPAAGLCRPFTIPLDTRRPRASRSPGRSGHASHPSLVVAARSGPSARRRREAPLRWRCPARRGAPSRPVARRGPHRRPLGCLWSAQEGTSTRAGPFPAGRSPPRNGGGHLLTLNGRLPHAPRSSTSGERLF